MGGDFARAHPGTTTGARLCPKDQPQRVRMPKLAEFSEIAWPRRVAAAGAPHTVAVRFRELLVLVSRCGHFAICAKVGVELGNAPFIVTAVFQVNG